MKFAAMMVCSVSMLPSAAIQADVAVGKSTYAAKGCIGCHGVDGQSVIPGNPVLKGHDAAFIQKNLTDFRSGARNNPMMNAMAAGLNDADIRNLADYIDSLK